MGNARFNLKEPSSKSDTLIYLIFRYNYKRFKYSTGEKINPKFWDEEKQRVKKTKQFPQYPEFNTRLNFLENGINTAFRKLLNDGIQPNNARLKKAFEEEISDIILKPNKTEFLDFINRFIADSRGIKKPNTIKVYKTAYNYLKSYSEKIGRNIDFEDINLDFYNKYLHFLSVENDLSVNTVGKHIKTIKLFMNEATDRGINENLEFKKSRFRATKEESDNVYLSVAELKKMEALDLKASPRLDKVRDLFLIGCYTGLRFSDFSQLKPENINLEKSVIQVRTRKTGERVAIPLHKTVKRILNKYKNDLPKAYTNQVMNRYLKEVASLSGLKQEVEKTATKGGRLRKESVKKFNLVSTHTARRSFATNLYLADIPAISIMKITGHRSERSFLQYIRVTQEQNADKLSNHPFFN